MKTLRVWNGYKIFKIEEGRKLYLKSYYRGVAKYVTDYTYAKIYANLASAERVIYELEVSYV